MRSPLQALHQYRAKNPVSSIVIILMSVVIILAEFGWLTNAVYYHLVHGQYAQLGDLNIQVPFCYSLHRTSDYVTLFRGVHTPQSQIIIDKFKDNSAPHSNPETTYVKFRDEVLLRIHAQRLVNESVISSKIGPMHCFVALISDNKYHAVCQSDNDKVVVGYIGIWKNLDDLYNVAQNIELTSKKP